MGQYTHDPVPAGERGRNLTGPPRGTVAPADLLVVVLTIAHLDRTQWSWGYADRQYADGSGWAVWHWVPNPACQTASILARAKFPPGDWPSPRDQHTLCSSCLTASGLEGS